MIIQQVKQVDVNTSGKAAYTLKQYEQNYKPDDLSTLEAAVQTLAEGSASSDNTNRLVKRELTLSDVNNKNRYHYVLPLYNSVQTAEDVDKTVYKNCKYLYRAYSYMQFVDKNDTTRTVISEKPTYFYMYDIANA